MAKYVVRVGSRLYAGDIAEVTHTHAGSQMSPQAAPVPSAAVAQWAGQRVFVSVAGVNAAGVEGVSALREYEVLRNGQLVPIAGDCGSLTCMGHCSCGANSGPCPVTQQCNSGFRPSAAEMLSVQAGVDVRTVQRYSQSAGLLAGSWTRPARTVLFYEFSAGTQGQAPGAGIFDVANERVWHSAGTQTNAQLFTPRALADGVYVFYVRAWFSATESAVFASGPITVDTVAPRRAPAAAVRELAQVGADLELDFYPWANFTIDWTGVFVAVRSPIKAFEVALGTAPGLDNVMTWRTSPSSQTSLPVPSAVQLTPNVTYYSTVMAINEADAFTLAESDGIMVHDARPSAAQAIVEVYRPGGTPQPLVAVVPGQEVFVAWHDLTDAVAGIAEYAVALSKHSATHSAASSLLLPWRPVGLHANASLTIPTNAPAQVFVLVRATSGGGVTAVAGSNALAVDATPPKVGQCAQYAAADANLVANPSFESGGTSWHGGLAVQTASASYPAYDGTRYAVVDTTGAASGTLSLPAQRHFRLALALAMPEDSADATTALTVQLGQLTRVLPLVARPASLGQWEHVTLHFATSDVDPSSAAGTVTAKLQLMANSPTGVAVDMIQLLACAQMDANPDASSLQHVLPALITHSSTLHPAWSSIYDDESAVSFTWAAGTVRGGQQLVPFQSVGGQQYAQATGLQLQHGEQVHVTVVARNRAGLTTVVHGAPAVVDLTPPAVEVDIVSASSDVHARLVALVGQPLEVKVRVLDAESGIARCQAALGRAPGLDNVAAFRDMALDAAVFSVPAAEPAVYASVRCFNGAGLSAVAESPEIEVVTMAAPQSLDLQSTADDLWTTPYAPTTHQSHTDAVSLAWNSDLAGVQRSLVSVYAKGQAASDWLDVHQNMSARMAGLALTPAQPYEAAVRLAYLGGATSQPATVAVLVDTTAPVITGAAIQTQYNASSGVLLTVWTGVFRDDESSPLVFEVSLGSLPGTSNILHWIQASEPRLEAQAALQPGRTYFLTLTAVNPAGLFSTISGHAVHV